MKATERQKMCLNCDGRIPYEAGQCPYCFALITPEQAAAKYTPSASHIDPLEALYKPLYQSKQALDRFDEPQAPASTPSGRGEDTGDQPRFSSIFMLVLGSNLLTLSLLQFFFSEQGTLHLEINASYWFLMLIVAIPLLYFGLKKDS